MSYYVGIFFVIVSVPHNNQTDETGDNNLTNVWSHVPQLPANNYQELSEGGGITFPLRGCTELKLPRVTDN